MAPVHKGKQAAKGSKQIIEENSSTLKFYRNMAVISNAVSLIILVWFHSSVSIFFYIFSSAVYIGAYQFMTFMARVKYTETGQVVDCGVDLNMEGGISEHIKDIIILTSACQLLAATISNYFWMLWLLVPLRALWIAWKNILAPYFFQSSDMQPEVDEKKQKKLERRMKRQQH